MTEPLVLIPGMMCDARIFMPQLVELTKERSVQIASVACADSITGMARSVLAQAPQTFAMAGYSMGGTVAMEVLRLAPERVNRVALISTSAATETPQAAALREPQIVRARTGGLSDVVAEIFTPELFHDGPARPRILDLFQEMAARLGPEVFARQSHALQGRPDQQRTLRMVNVPAVVIGGAADQMAPPARHEFIAGMMKNAELKIIENAGHLPMVETADEVTEALKTWLAGPLVLR